EDREQERPFAARERRVLLEDEGCGAGHQSGTLPPAGACCGLTMRKPRCLSSAGLTTKWRSSNLACAFCFRFAKVKWFRLSVASRITDSFTWKSVGSTTSHRFLYCASGFLGTSFTT